MNKLLLLSVGLLVTFVIVAISLPIHKPKEIPNVANNHLAVYYGYPSSVNNSNGDVQKATNEFSKFDIIVFGDSVEHPIHGDYANSKKIIKNLNSVGNKLIFGYIDLGVTNSTQHNNLDTIKQYIDEWVNLNVQGVFLDDFGYDYGVTRNRQNEVVDYAHSKGLKVFANSWDVDQALGDIDEKGQTNPTHITKGDWYLAESWLVGANKYNDISSWQNKADKCLDYKKMKGINIAVVSTNVANGTTLADKYSDQFKMAWWSSTIYGFPFQWTDNYYSSGNNNLIYYDKIVNNIEIPLTVPPVHITSTQTVLDTAQGKIVVEGDGSTWGTGHISTE
jgi:hypothetical protein